MRQALIRLYKNELDHDFNTRTFKRVDASFDQSSERSQNAIASDTSEDTDGTVMARLRDFRVAKMRTRIAFAIIVDTTAPLAYDDVQEGDDAYEFRLKVADDTTPDQIRGIGTKMHEYIVRGTLYDWYNYLGVKPTDTPDALDDLEDEITSMLRGRSWGHKPMQPFGPAHWKYDHDEPGRGGFGGDGFRDDRPIRPIDGAPQTNKQDKLISGENIKTINGESILGKGDIVIKGADAEPYDDTELRSRMLAMEVKGYSWDNKQDEITDLEEIRHGAVRGYTAYQKPDDGVPYSDLDPAVQTMVAKGTTAVQPSQLAPVATTGSYDSLNNKPAIPGSLSELGSDSLHMTVTETEKQSWSGKQERLVSGTNIKTINGESLLGEGNIEIQGGGGGGFTPTTTQLNAMDSGITSDKVAKYDGYASGKQDVIGDLDDIREGASKGATAVQPSDLPSVPTKLSDLEDDATHRLVTDADKSKWNLKQNTIADLATIRSGAAKGATSVQTSGDQRIDGRKIFTDLRVEEKTLDENILFEAGYEAESDLLRLNINDTYDGESVILGHVADPVLDYDAVNKQTLNAEIAKVQPGKTYAFAITPDMYDIEFDPTKGVTPYNTSKGYTNITIHEDAGVEWVEGGMYTIMVTATISDTYRNGRVRIGKNGTWYPLVTVATNQVITATSILNVNQTTVMVFKKNYFPEGALHCLYVTTYAQITQAEIDAGTSTASRVVTPKLMMENYGSKIAALETKMDEVYDDYTTANSLL